MIGNQPKFKYVFLEMDFVILTISFFLSLKITIPDSRTISEQHFYLSFGFLFLLYLFVLTTYLFSFLFNNLYKRDVVLYRYRQLVLIVKSLLVGSVITILFMIVFNMDYFTLHGKKLILYFSLCSFALFFLVRVIIAKKIFVFLAKKNIYQRRLLIVGGDKAGKHVADSLRRDTFSDFHIVGFLDDYKEAGEKIHDHFYNLGKLNDLGNVVMEHKVGEILIAIDNTPYERLIYIVEKCLQTGKVVRIYSDLMKVIAEKMKVEFYSSIPVIMLSQYSLGGHVWKFKRGLDIIMALIALITLFPLFLAVAIGIKLSSKGPVIFKQVRIGKGGRPFNFYKFRSMHIGTDNSKHKEYVRNLIQNGSQSKSQKIKVFKVTDDPRIFKFGRFIRKTSLDEFPQLINVIKGDMGLVGPRPCLPYEWDCYDEWHRKRLTIPPGCTGLWQALGRSTVSFEEMVILDLYYISNMSLWLDLKIVLQTFPVIILGKGGY